MTTLPTEGRPLALATGARADPGALAQSRGQSGYGNLAASTGDATEADTGVLIRLLQLASPSLPVGGFSYSQGLEWAVESGVIRDAADSAAWIRALLEGPVGYADTAFLARFHLAWRNPDATQLLRLDRLFQASRESAELLAETRQMGWSMLSLSDALSAHRMGHAWLRIQPVLAGLRAAEASLSYPLVWSALVLAAGLSLTQGLSVWLWSWLENQVLAALKTVPLGQAAGQNLLLELGALLPAIIARSVEAAGSGPGLAEWDPAMAEEDSPGTFAPAYALACARHETQYSRLFRS